MEEKDLISVVVPVYNIEKYIEKCVKSILSQTYKNLEIFLIDDGAKDYSGKICDDLAKLDSRIIVIHKQNEGLSETRNVGIRKSTGRYITFIDGDDYILPTFIQDLYEAITLNDADLAINSFIMQDEGKELIYKEKEPYTIVMNKDTLMETFLYQKHFTTSAWCKLYKKELFDNISFPKGKLCEDMGTLYKILHITNKAVYISSQTYVYIQRKTSIMHAQQLEVERDYIKLTSDMKDFIVKNYPNLKDAAFSRFFSSNIQMLMTIPFSQIYKPGHETIINNIKQLRSSVIKNKKARMINRGCALLSYPGIRVLKLCLNILSK